MTRPLMNMTGIRARGLRGPQGSPPMHQNQRTDTYLRCLQSGARVVDPGDLDPATEFELARLTATGQLICKRHHGRRIWRRT